MLSDQIYFGIIRGHFKSLKLFFTTGPVKQIFTQKLGQNCWMIHPQSYNCF